MTTDNSQWQAPGDATPPPVTPPPGDPAPMIPPPAPGFTAPAAYAPPTPYGAPAATPAPFGAPQAGWTPPPKPGLVPLQPLTLGSILSGSFQVMRRNPKPTFGISLTLNGIVAVIALLVLGLVSALTTATTITESSTPGEIFGSALAGSDSISTYAQSALLLFATAILQGIISIEVARSILGEKLPLRELWNRAKGRVGALIGWALLTSVIVFVSILVVAFIIAGIALAIGGTGGLVFGILVGLLALLGFVVVAFWIGTKVSLVPSAIVLERAPLLVALRRSWSLTRGYFWRTLGIQLLVSAIIGIATSIITTPVGLIIGITTALGNPNGDLDAMGSSLAVASAAGIIISALVGSVTAIIAAASTSLIYIDLRMRKEGLDLDLIRFVESRQTGGTPLADPYQSPSTVAGAPSAAPQQNGGPTPPPTGPPADSPWA